MAMARSRSTRAGSSTIDRLSPCKSHAGRQALLCAASSGRGSNLPFTVRRRGTWANSGSTDGAGRRLKTMRATGRSTVHGPAGKSCVSVRQPSAAAAIDRISRKQPWPIRIWRDSGSVCGSRRPPSTKSSTSPSAAEVDEPRLQIVRAGCQQREGQRPSARVALGRWRTAPALDGGRRHGIEARHCDCTPDRRNDHTRTDHLDVIPARQRHGTLHEHSLECIYIPRNVIRQAQSASAGTAHLSA